MDDYLERQKNTVEVIPLSDGEIVLTIKTGQVTQAQVILDIVQANDLINDLARAAERSEK